MASTKEIKTEVLPFIRVFKDGTVERLLGSPIVPPSLTDSVSSKDIVISNDPSISARVYLPNSIQSFQKIPILVYFHAGGFCIESAFSFLHNRYVNHIVSEANVIAVSVEYRQAPEHFLPAAFNDGWQALNWVASHSNSVENNADTEPWLKNHGDFSRVYIGGDSAGGTIVHNLAIRAGVETLKNNVKILGAFLSHPYFWGSEPVGSEPNQGNASFYVRIWNFVYPCAVGGIDNPTVNPCGPGAPNLARIGCSKVLVCVASKDELRDRGIWYYEAVKNSEWQGEVELFEIEDEGHAFHIADSETENAKIMIRRLASFLL